MAVLSITQRDDLQKVQNVIHLKSSPKHKIKGCHFAIQPACEIVFACLPAHSPPAVLSKGSAILYWEPQFEGRSTGQSKQ